MRVETISGQQVIETERFILRPVQKSDAGQLRMYAGDQRVAEFTSSIPHPLPRGATQSFIERALNPERSEDVWIMASTKDEVLGVISLKTMDRAQSEIGYWVAPAFWGAGYASEAVRAILEANPQKCKTIFAEVFQDNPASARVLTNAGFEYLGDAEKFSVARNTSVATWTYLLKYA
ncbi:GNAT family N-acetyltransferase [Falsihalocynthiibacter sp. S25ZX9]|uniref:GNAT family N-acetyltransferase n=1 Tax=Falsihalocynthiibacter sp. S25ZX9 TaxID=3240870 RepID=UPI0035102CAD